jgi:hypothetical protein
LELDVGEPEVVIDTLPQVDDPLEWVVRIPARDGSWAPYLPPLEWPLRADGPLTVLRWPADEADIHRIVIRDETLDAISLKPATTEDHYVLEWSRLVPGHQYRWRVQRWSEGRWENSTEFVPLTGALSTAERIELRERQAPEASWKAPILFLFTSDTESNLTKLPQPDFERAVREHIWGSFPDGEAGIRFQMDLLEERGFKGTFFVDVLAEYQLGEGSLQPVYDEILRRGHDVQLHLHPNPHLRFARDERLRRLARATLDDDPAAFRAAMELAMERFERRAGRLPVAYRAGAYRIFDSHFPILRELGFAIDTSINPFKHSAVAPWLKSRTQPFWVDGLLEIPISLRARYRRGAWQVQQFVPQVVASLQLPALEPLLAAAPVSPVTICCIAHSVSFLRRSRPQGQERIRDWNESWRDLVGPEEFERSRLARDTPFWFFETADRELAQDFRRTLASLSARQEVRGISLASVAELSPDFLSARHLPVDPLPAYDPDSRRELLLQSRVYSGSYLESLESLGRSGSLHVHDQLDLRRPG